MDQAVKPWRRLAIIFPGQGSQYAGMGERLARVSRAALDVFKRADEVLDMRISKLCFEGTAEELEPTITQQPATFVTSAAWLAALQERWAQLDRKLEPVFFAGHSLGEFTAAVAAGSLSFEEGALLVRERGRLMDEAGREFPGGMASILGLPEAKVVEICEEASRDGYVGISNANCEGQTVISGAVNALKTAMELAEKARARRVVRLPISIASHSPLMTKASEGMNRLLQKLPMRDPAAPLVGNVNAGILETEPEVYAELRDQLTSGVYWHRSIEAMKARGVDMFMEVGPGSVLTKLVRRIDYEVNSLSISDDYEGLLGDNFKLVEAAAL
ncbi:MAG: ACP S-malonyltransferase [Dehalococcoidia bacterium]